MRNTAREFYEIYEKAMDIKRNHPIRLYRPNAGCEKAFHQSGALQRVMSGANSSGKSYSSSAEVGYWVEPEYDEEGKETGYACHPYRRIKLPVYGVISSPTEEVQRAEKGGTQAYIKHFCSIAPGDVVAERGVWKYAKTKTGCVLDFKTKRSGRDAYQSLELDFAWLDEPHGESVWNEAVARLIRSKPPGSMWMSMTPIYDRKKEVSREDVVWAIQKLIKPTLLKKRAGEPPGILDVWQMPLEENKENIDVGLVEELYSTMDKDERLIRMTGQYISLDGGGGFDGLMLELLMDNARNASFEGKIKQVGGKFEMVEEFYDEFAYNDFAVRIWHKPIGGHRYAIGTDVGGTTDPTSVTVVDIDRVELVAELHGMLDELDLAVELQVLGMYYNAAEIAIEVNKEGKVTASSMTTGNERLGIIQYPELYRRPRPAYLQRGYDMASYEVGWMTTTGTRDYLIGEIRALLGRAKKLVASGGESPLPSPRHIAEMQTFVEGRTGKLEAMKGEHDDRIFSLAIALMVCHRHNRDWSSEVDMRPDPTPEVEVAGGSIILTPPDEILDPASHNPYGLL